MSKRLYQWFGLMAVGGLVGCSDLLDATNYNNPDRDRALATPTDVEQTIRDSWNSLHVAIFHGNDALNPQMMVMGMENHAELANFGMGARGGIPRAFINNSRGNAVETGNARDFTQLHRAARLAAVALRASNTPDFTIGSTDADVRARAFAKFVMGVAHGYLAAAYDSAAIIHEDDDLGEINPLSESSAVHAAALAYLQEAIDIAQSGPAFSYPTSWFRTAGAVSRDDFVRIVRSYRARIRPMVARSAEQRAAVDWSAVIADAENGMTSDLIMNFDPAEGWNLVWLQQHFNGSNWHVMWQFMVGMAADAASYNAWLAAPRSAKNRFLIVTPDQRFPQGTTRAQQLENSPTVPPAGQYFITIPEGQDVDSEFLGRSMYQHARFRALRDANRVGTFPYFQRAELDLLAAEGHIHEGNIAAAAELIDVTREGRGGLPALTGVITSATQEVPGGTSCVPRVPVGTRNDQYQWAGSACGTIMEAMKWEKRMELAFTGWGAWYFDSRGWGDLPERTPLEWMVPWQELDTRLIPIYHGGQTVGVNAAERGTYDL